MLIRANLIHLHVSLRFTLICLFPIFPIPISNFPILIPSSPFLFHHHTLFSISFSSSLSHFPTSLHESVWKCECFFTWVCLPITRVCEWQFACVRVCLFVSVCGGGECLWVCMCRSERACVCVCMCVTSENHFIPLHFWAGGVTGCFNCFPHVSELAGSLMHGWWRQGVDAKMDFFCVIVYLISRSRVPQTINWVGLWRYIGSGNLEVLLGTYGG